MGNELIVSVQNRIQEMQHGEGLRLPTGYSVGNALNSAYLILSDNSKENHYWKNVTLHQCQKLY